MKQEARMLQAMLKTKKYRYTIEIVKEVKGIVKPAHPKAAPELKAEVKEEKAVEEIKKTKAKDETKKLDRQKGLLKKFRGFFRRRTNM